jgi:hypothetical protein
MWLARSAEGFVWIANPTGFYFDFDQQSGPYFVRLTDAAIVYRNPVPELFALQSLDACEDWLGYRTDSAVRRPAEYAGRPVEVHDAETSWGASTITTDVETGAVLRVIRDGPRGRLELAISAFEVTTGVQLEEFSWTGPVRAFDGARVHSLD